MYVVKHDVKTLKKELAQDCGSSQCISIYTTILSPGNIQQHLKAVEAVYIYIYADPVYSGTKSVQKLF